VAVFSHRRKIGKKSYQLIIIFGISVGGKRQQGACLSAILLTLASICLTTAVGILIMFTVAFHAFGHRSQAARDGTSTDADRTAEIRCLPG
jgi:hypothetical protein